MKERFSFSNLSLSSRNSFQLLSRRVCGLLFLSFSIFSEFSKASKAMDSKVARTNPVAALTATFEK